MDPWTDVELESAHVRVRARREADAEPTLRQLRDEPRMLRWLPWDGPRDLAEARELPWFLSNELGVEVRLAIVARSADTLVGGSFLRVAAAGGAGELGYWIGPDHQGQGYGTEAVGLLAHLAFGELGVGILTARVQVGNLASMRVLEKVGFQFTFESPPSGNGPGQRHFTLLPGDSVAPAPRSSRVST